MPIPLWALKGAAAVGKFYIRRKGKKLMTDQKAKAKFGAKVSGINMLNNTRVIKEEKEKAENKKTDNQKAARTKGPAVIGPPKVKIPKKKEEEMPGYHGKKKMKAKRKPQSKKKMKKKRSSKFYMKY